MKLKLWRVVVHLVRSRKGVGVTTLNRNGQNVRDFELNPYHVY